MARVAWRVTGSFRQEHRRDSLGCARCYALLGDAQPGRRRQSISSRYDHRGTSTATIETIGATLAPLRADIVNDAAAV
jgi:hypothetical protein